MLPTGRGACVWRPGAKWPTWNWKTKSLVRERSRQTSAIVYWHCRCCKSFHCVRHPPLCYSSIPRWPSPRPSMQFVLKQTGRLCLYVFRYSHVYCPQIILYFVIIGLIILPIRPEGFLVEFWLWNVKYVFFKSLFRIQIATGPFCQIDNEHILFVVTYRGAVCPGTSGRVPWHHSGNSQWLKPLLCAPHPGWQRWVNCLLLSYKYFVNMLII